MRGIFARAAAFHRRHPVLSWGARGVVSAALVAFILASLDLGDLEQVVAEPGWVWLGAMVLAAWAFLLVGSVKYWILFRAHGPVPLRPFVGYFFVASSLGAFTPASLGEFSLVAFLRREGVAGAHAMAAMLVDRAVTFAVYGAVFVPLTVGLFVDAAWTRWVPALAIPAGAAFLFALSRLVGLRARVNRWLARYPLGLLADFLRAVSVLLRARPWHLAANVALTLVRCVVSATVVLFALWAAGERPDFAPVLYVTNSLSLLTLVPVSIAGIGVYEGGGVALFAGAGLDGERVFAALLYQRLYVVGFALLCLAAAPLLLRARPRAAENGESLA